MNIWDTEIIMFQVQVLEINKCNRKKTFFYIYKYIAMLRKLFIEMVATAAFAFIVFSTKNYLMIGAITALNIYLTNGFALFNPTLALMNYINGSYTMNQMLMLICSEFIGAFVGFQLYSIIYKKGITL